MMFTKASLRLLANVRKREQLKGILKSIRTIKTLVSRSEWHFLQYMHQGRVVFNSFLVQTSMTIKVCVCHEVSFMSSKVLEQR